MPIQAPPRLFTLGDGQGLTLTVMDIGATWLSCRVPLADGALREVLLGHAVPEDHLGEPGYLGGVVGRYANRIANARFSLGGRVHELTANEGRHQLHGGPEGFNRRRWQVLSAGPRRLRLALDSPAGDQGYPGALHAEVEYRIDPPRSVTMSFEAVVDEPGPVNLTSHAYFNLDGDARDIRGHRIRIAAARYLPVDATLIPTGELASAQDTPFDLRSPCGVGAGLGAGPQQQLAGGYDHCFVLDAACAGGAVPAAELWSADRHLAMRLSTDYPGLQFYSGQQLQSTRGRDGQVIARFAGLALEAQFFPDAPNRPEWPGAQACWLQPGQRLQRFIRWDFDAASSAG